MTRSGFRLKEQQDQIVGLQRTSGPSTQLISTSEMKDHSRVDLSADDDLIDTYIQAARYQAEEMTRRSFLETTWELVLDDWPIDDVLPIPRPPLRSIDSIDYTDEDGGSNTFSSSDYLVITNSLPGRVVLDNTTDWPTDDLEPYGGITVTFKAGYGADSTDGRSDVPDPIRQAVRMMVAHFYENRESVVIGTTGFDVPQAVKYLLGPFKYRDFNSVL